MHAAEMLPRLLGELHPCAAYSLAGDIACSGQVRDGVATNTGQLAMREHGLTHCVERGRSCLRIRGCIEHFSHQLASPSEGLQGLSKSRRSQDGPMNCDIRLRHLLLSRGDNFDSSVSKDCKLVRFHVPPASASARAIFLTCICARDAKTWRSKMAVHPMRDRFTLLPCKARRASSNACISHTNEISGFWMRPQKMHERSSRRERTAARESAGLVPASAGASQVSRQLPTIAMSKERNQLLLSEITMQRIITTNVTT